MHNPPKFDDSIVGKRITCLNMNDVNAVPSGTEGVIRKIDDIGQIHVNWDNGSQLALVPGVDDYKIHSS